MIAQFVCYNFKALANFSVDFKSDLTAIAGPNGSGKTTICQALSTAGRLVAESPQLVMDDVSQGDWDLIKNKWERTNTPYFITTAKEADRCVQWGIKLIKEEKWGILNEFVDRIANDGKKRVLQRERNKVNGLKFDKESNDWRSFTEIKNIPSYLSTVVNETKHEYPEIWTLKQNVNIRYIPFLDPVLLRRKSNWPALGDTGQNFAYYLSVFKQRNPEKFKNIVAKMKIFFPWLEDVWTKSTKFGWTEIQAKIKPEPEEDNVFFRSWQINDGLLRLLALATIPHAEPNLKMLVFEEPENGIHPKLIGATVDLLRSFEGIQVVLTTHSPVLLNFLRPEEVVVLVPQGKKGPVAVPFVELDKAEERLEYFDVGDILFHESEQKLAEPYLRKLREQRERKS